MEASILEAVLKLEQSLKVWCLNQGLDGLS